MTPSSQFEIIVFQHPVFFYGFQLKLLFLCSITLYRLIIIKQQILKSVIVLVKIYLNHLEMNGVCSVMVGSPLKYREGKCPHLVLYDIACLSFNNLVFGYR